MMQNDIQKNPYIQIVCLVHQFFQFFLGAPTFVHVHIILYRITMVGFRIIFENRAEPKGGTAQIFDIIDIVDDTFNSASKRLLQLIFIPETGVSDIEIFRMPLITIMKSCLLYTSPS